MKTVFVVDDNVQIGSMFRQRDFKPQYRYNGADHPDLICLPGGADVTPNLYGAKAHSSVYSYL